MAAGAAPSEVMAMTPAEAVWWLDGITAEAKAMARERRR